MQQDFGSNQHLLPFGSNTCRGTATNPQICGDDFALRSQGVFDSYLHRARDRANRNSARRQSQQFFTTEINCSNDQHNRDNREPFDSISRKRTTEEEETRMITHRSNKITSIRSRRFTQFLTGRPKFSNSLKFLGALAECPALLQAIQRSITTLTLQLSFVTF